MASRGTTRLSFVGGAVLALFTVAALALGGGVWWLQEQQRREQRFDSIIERVAREEGIDPHLVRAVIWRESRFDPQATGAAKERGLMQVTPIAAADWVKQEQVQGFCVEQLHEPEVGIRAGAWYLARALRRWRETDNPVPFALAEYNAGRSHALRWVDEKDPASAVRFLRRIDFPTTRAYIEEVMQQWHRYQQGQGGTSWRVLWSRVEDKLGLR